MKKYGLCVLITLNVLALLFGAFKIITRDTYDNIKQAHSNGITFTIGQRDADCAFCLPTIITNHTEYEILIPGSISDIDFFNGEIWEAAAMQYPLFIWGHLLVLCPYNCTCNNCVNAYTSNVITQLICLSYFQLEEGLHRVRLHSRNAAYLNNRPRREPHLHITAFFWWTGDQWVSL